MKKIAEKEKIWKKAFFPVLKVNSYTKYGVELGVRKVSYLLLQIKIKITSSNLSVQWELHPSRNCFPAPSALAIIINNTRNGILPMQILRLGKYLHFAATNKSFFLKRKWN